MILADTSVWIDYFREDLPELGERLRRREVVMRDNHLAMTVSWTSGGAGLYTAAMSPAGLLTHGSTQNISLPTSMATWSTAREFQCVAR